MAIKFTLAETDYFIGDTIRVSYKIKEKDKERLQAFDGIILAIKGRGENQTFTVQKNASDSIRVERIFPVNSPWISSLKRIRQPKIKIRRAKLYYLRNPKVKTI
ncbi:MAG: 50S ribosomal protein L19 [Candidatus Shapirobacteria bacterium]|jgi:large subunit ribosomal protein L19